MNRDETMLQHKTVVDVLAGQSNEFYTFMLNCTDDQYQAWWPGTHLAWHTHTDRPGKIGSVVYFDEYVGKRRLKFEAIITEIVKDQKIVWQLEKWVPLPAWLILEFADSPNGIKVTHTLAIGFQGIGRLLDPVLRLYFTPGYAKDLDEHARTEFPRLASMLADKHAREHLAAGVK
jgi:hypothetical protein